MRRRDFIGFIGGATAWPLTARAQQSTMTVIGFMTEVPGVAHLNATFLPPFLRGMAEFGYVEGKNFAIEYRLNPESLPEAATNLVSRNVNAIFAIGPAAVAAASKATTSIPVVALDLESDPVAKGYVQSIARPGGNITGMFLDIPELSGKQLEVLKEIVPRLSRIAVFGIPGLDAPQFAATVTAARWAGVEVEILGCGSPMTYMALWRRPERGTSKPVSRGHVFEANRGACARQPASAHFLVRRISKKRRPRILWTELCRHVSKMRGICWQDSARCQAKRVTATASGEVRSRDQPQNCHGNRCRCASAPPAACRRDHRMRGMSAIGPSAKWRHAPLRSAQWGVAD